MKPIRISDKIDFMKNKSISQSCPICGIGFEEGEIVVRVESATSYCTKYHISCSLKFSDIIKEALDYDGNKVFYENL